MSEPSPSAGARIDRDFARKLDWNLLKVFIQIVRAGGIGAAARSLNKQHPSISAALKRLEDQLGARLFERSTSGIRITQAGKALQAICEDVFDNVRMAQHQVAQASKRVSGEVHIQLLVDHLSRTRRSARLISPSPSGYRYGAARVGLARRARGARPWRSRGWHRLRGACGARAD
jgi:hypothetical protein